MEVVRMLKHFGRLSPADVVSLLSEFTYRKLDTGWTRVASIAKGVGSDPLFCSIDHWQVRYRHDPNQSPNINALSYTWGSDREAVPLIVQDYETREVGFLKITQSLATALVAIREPDSWITVWVDQISINQEDHEEKIEQLQLMRAIYESVSHVAAWIGPAADNSDAVMDSVESAQWTGKIDVLFGHLQQGQSMFEACEAFSRVLPCSLDAVIAFFNRPYWGRVWILQEATALPTNRTIILCGHHKLSFNAFFSIVNMALPLQPHLFQLTHRLRQFVECLVPLQGYSKFAGERHKSREPWFCPLLKLMVHTRALNVTDARDRVNVMLNYTAENQTIPELTLKPSYSMTSRDFYRHVAMWHMTCTKSLDVLGAATCYIGTSFPSVTHIGPITTTIGDNQSSNQNSTQVGSEYPGARKHPSWVPNWGDPDLLPLLWKYQFPDSASSPLLFKAAGCHVDNLQARFRDTESVRCLCPCGLKIGVITATTNVWGHDGPTGHDGHGTLSRWLGSEPLLEKYDFTNETLENAIKRTIVTDCRSIAGTSDRPLMIRRLLRDEVPIFDMPAAQVSLVGDEPVPWAIDIGRSTFQRRLISTSTTNSFFHESALYGLAPWTVMPGDELWILRGGKMVYALRPRQRQIRRSVSEDELIYIGHVLDLTTSNISERWTVNPQVYTLAGECYVHGLMDGIVVDLLESGVNREEWPLPLRNVQSMWQSIYLS